MHLKWLEDFVTLAETRSFSEAAQLRHVTQPAFGRRIRALETWMRTDLVDREGCRPALTPAGKLFLDLAADIVERLEDTRTMLAEEGRRPASTLTVAASHTLSVHYYPKFLGEIDVASAGITSSLVSVNSHEGILRLADGGCDLLISYHHPQIAVGLDRERFPYLTLGHDEMVPLSKPGPDGRPLHALPGTEEAPANFLTYAPSIFMGRAVSGMLANPPAPLFLRATYTTDMSQAVKAMMLDGRGLGWLPRSSVEAELAAGLLVSAVPPEAGPREAWNAPLELRVYRAADNRKAVLCDLWSSLLARFGRSGAAGVPDARLAQVGAETAFAEVSPDF